VTDGHKETKRSMDPHMDPFIFKSGSFAVVVGIGGHVDHQKDDGALPSV
jgi:hypothetical protein